MTTDHDPPQVRHLLLIRLDNMGDVLMCTPAMRALRQTYPQAKITLLTSPSGAQLQPHLDLVDEVIVHRASWVAVGPDQRPDSEQALVAQLQRAEIDAAILFTTATQSALPMALLCRMAGIPIRLAHSRENPYGLLSHWVRDTEQVKQGMRHEVDRQLALVQTLGVTRPDDDRLAFHVRPQDHEEAQALLLHQGLPPGRPYVVFHPGATAASRRYPPERFGEVADQLTQEGWPCVFAAGHGEQDLVAQALAQTQHPVIDLTGKLSLGGLAALIQGARLLIGNNSGAMHIAAAVGTPVVCLYALTNPQHTPWRVPSQVLNHWVDCCHCLRSVCPHTHHACLRGVPPQRVLHAATTLLDLMAHPDPDSRTPPVFHIGREQHGLPCQT
ncbi:MAG: lipopolysaccharide heptosyltransferase II [Acidobacteriota bacterium]